MDRRYTGMRFYNGVRASTGSKEKAESLVRSYLSNINKVNRQSQDYGGSTGGRQSIDQNAGLVTIGDRQSRQADARRVFDQQGIGRFGARKESWIAKQYEAEDREAMEDRQFGREDS